MTRYTDPAVTVVVFSCFLLLFTALAAAAEWIEERMQERSDRRASREAARARRRERIRRENLEALPGYNQPPSADDHRVAA